MRVKFQPDGYHTLTPYLIISGAAKANEFYKQAFGAEDLSPGQLDERLKALHG